MVPSATIISGFLHGAQRNLLVKKPTPLPVKGLVFSDLLSSSLFEVVVGLCLNDKYVSVHMGLYRSLF